MSAAVTFLSAVAPDAVRSWPGPSGVLDGLLLGVIVVVALIVAGSARRVAFEGAPLALGVIDNAYTVAGCFIVGAILGARR